MGTQTDSTAKTNWTTVAHLLRPQGRKGELLAELLTDFPGRFKDSPAVWLAKPGFTGGADQARALTVCGFWLPVGRNQGRIVLHFEGVDSINAAEELEALDVLIPTAERMELEDGAEYIDELIGATVFDGEIALGTVEAIDFPTTPDGGRRLPDAAPLLTLVTTDGEEILIPFVQAFVVKVDTAAGRIYMTLPEGLAELNKGSL